MKYEISVYLVTEYDKVPTVYLSQEFEAHLPGQENFLTEMTKALRHRSLMNGREYHECLAGRRTWQSRESPIAGYNAYAMALENETEIQILIRPAVVPCLS